MFPFFVLLDVSREKSHITGKVPGGRLPRPFLNSRTRTINLILSFIAYSLNKDTLESFILLFFTTNVSLSIISPLKEVKPFPVAIKLILLVFATTIFPLKLVVEWRWLWQLPSPPPPNDIDLGVGLSLKLSHVRLYICNNHIFTTCLVWSFFAAQQDDEKAKYSPWRTRRPL